MRARLLAILAASLLLLLTAPLPQAAGTTSTPPRADETAQESFRGTLVGPGRAPLEGVTITVFQGNTEIGSATTAEDGTWQIPVPAPGRYDVVLDLDTLPQRLQPRQEGGERLTDVVVAPGRPKTVLFPLIRAAAEQEPGVTPSPGVSPGPAPGVEEEGTRGVTRSRPLQLVVEGIKLGSIIAITAVGLSLVFGTTRLINFAHGELVTLGAVIAYFSTTTWFGIPLILATFVAIAVGALAGGVLERGIWRPMRRRGSGLIQMFIISIGLSLLVRHVILVWFGSRRRQYQEYAVQDSWDFGLVSITPRDFIVTVLSVFVLLGVAFLLQRTRIGKATRAVADNKDLAESSGIDVDRVILTVWLIGGGLAALGGVFYGLTQVLAWDMGFRVLLLMFAGVILGGLGSAYGAMVGSFVVGLVAQLSTLWFPPELQNAWALLALIVILLIRPQGILGRAERAG